MVDLFTLNLIIQRISRAKENPSQNPISSSQYN